MSPSTASMSQPSRSVLEAFNLHGTPTPLEGGRGLCFQVNDTVLKPSEDYEESQFIAEVINKLHSIRPPRPTVYLSRTPRFLTRLYMSKMAGQPGAFYLAVMLTELIAIPLCSNWRAGSTLISHCLVSLGRPF
uniref:Uncharacterized protein n=1 Tax=Bionectria ochroleuca TaxID=29856 RepID=A0A8H7NEE9_BIOOC